MLTILFILIILALAVWAGRAILSGLGAPAWMVTVAIAMACIFAVVLVANAAGVPIPSLK